MRCKSCDYPLWNLKARQCPECGTAFNPSDYEFVLNSVRFCCPHCDQAYYGTGFKGHLVPPEFNCVKCGRHVTMNQMVLRPAVGVEEQETQVGIMPWLQRQSIGWWPGWFKTIMDGLLRPTRLMRAVPVAGVGNAWWFATVTCLLVLTAGIAVPCLVAAVFFFSDNSRKALHMLITGPSAVFGGTLAILIGMLLWGLTAHGMLKLTGGAAHSIGRTFQALLYSIGAIAPMGIPCIGPYCGIYVLWIWLAVSAILMLTEGQRVHGGRATLAVLTFPVIMGVLLVGGYFALLAAIFSSAQFKVNAASGPQLAETRILVQEIALYASAHDGQLPGHAVELVSANSLAVANFIATGTSTTEPKVPIGDTTLDQLQTMPTNKQRLAIQSAAANLPPNTIAHRVGDFVFTFHGMNLATDPNLWTVICSPDPDSIVAGTPPETNWIVGSAGGTAIVMPISSAMLGVQNQVRARYGLPPLPDPATVTHSKPATPSAPAASATQSDS